MPMKKQTIPVYSCAPGVVSQSEKKDTGLYDDYLLAHNSENLDYSMQNGKMRQHSLILARSSEGKSLGSPISKAFVTEIDRIRINAVSPGWVAETMVAMGMDPEPGMPAKEIAQIYVDLIEKSHSGEVIIAAKM